MNLDELSYNNESKYLDKNKKLYSNLKYLDCIPYKIICQQSNDLNTYFFEIINQDGYFGDFEIYLPKYQNIHLEKIISLFSFQFICRKNEEIYNKPYKLFDYHQIKCIHFIHKKKIIQNENYWIYPLSFITGILSPSLIQDMKIIISINFNNDYYQYFDKNIIFDIYCKKYIISTQIYPNILLNNLIVQNQYMGKFSLINKKTIIPIRFYHPIFMIYLYGISKNNIKNIKLVINHGLFFECYLEKIDTYSYVLNIKNENNDNFYFQYKDNENIYNWKTINFSSFDSIYFIIEKQIENEDLFIHIGALNYNFSIIHNNIIYDKS
jgi:hypothetical protein